MPHFWGMYIPDWFIVFFWLYALIPLILALIAIIWGLKRRQAGKPWRLFIVLPLAGLVMMSATRTIDHLNTKAQIENLLIVPPANSLEPGAVLWVHTNHDHCDDVCDQVIASGIATDLIVAKGGWGVWAPDISAPILNLRTTQLWKVDPQMPWDKTVWRPVGQHDASNIRYVLYSGYPTLMARTDPTTWQNAVDKDLLRRSVVLYDMQGLGEFDPRSAARVYQAGHGTSYFQPWPLLNSIAPSPKTINIPSDAASTQQLLNAVQR